MKSTEELREALVKLQLENHALSIDKAQAALLIGAVEKLLGDDSEDPFAGAFAALRGVFDFRHAVVLVEQGSGELHTLIADPLLLAGSRWAAGPFFAKVMAGRVATTISNEALAEWAIAPSALLSPRQPALYLPLKMRAQRGLMILLRDIGEEGFDRGHVVLARKFALLASLAFAARSQRQDKAESDRLKLVTERLEQSRAELSYRANHDELTELPNRAFMHELVHDALVSCHRDQKIALAFVDVDDFKRVNDLYSHSVGDALLKEVATRVRTAIRHDDVVGRISGDEFVILFRGYNSEADVRSTADRLVAALKHPMTVDGCDLRLSATFGIALYPDHGRSYDDLRRAADIAMYTAKHTAKGSVSYFTAEMGVAALAQMRLEERLRQAIAAQEFRCAYQPKFDLTSMTVVGFEALVRWIDDDRQVHQPLSFIEAAGRFGLLDDITMLVVEDVLRSLPLLDHRYGAATLVSFNVSARQIVNVAFMDRLVARLGASPWCRRLMLEATEEAFIESDILRNIVIPKLRQAGIRLSIDDFGRGYSSLSTLADIPADEVKVDRAFITDIAQRPRNQIVLKAIESLCGALGMAVIAEGIETKEELDYLMEHTSIRSGQGFLLKRPFFIEDEPANFQSQPA